MMASKVFIANDLVSVELLLFGAEDSTLFFRKLLLLKKDRFLKAIEVWLSDSIRLIYFIKQKSKWTNQN